jgi:hypothetical protein
MTVSTEADTSASLSPKTLEGSLRSFSLFEILQFLRLGSLTGVLTVSRTGEQIQLMVRGGKIVNSSIFTHRQRLGELLRVRGIVSRRDLDDILASKHKNAIEKPLGQILVERGILDADVLTQTLRLQIEEEIWALLQWRDGEFRFNPCMNLTEAAPALVEIEIEPLILEGARRQDEWNTISQHVASDDLIPIPVPPESFHVADHSLTANEWRLLALINGSLSVGALVDRSGLGRFETYRILATFVQQGWIACESQREAEERTSEAASRRSGDHTPSLAGSGELEVPPPNGNGANGKSSLLRWRRAPVPREAEAAPAQASRRHLTPVTMAAAVVNELLVACARRRIEDIHGRWPLTPLTWQRLTGRFPSADAVTVINGLVDVSMFDRLWVPLPAGLRGAMIEDTWGALADLTGELVEALRRQLPARDWVRVRDQICAAVRAPEISEPGPPEMSGDALLVLVEDPVPEEEDTDGR